MQSVALFGWLWVLVGLLTGVWMGLMFHRDDWLGGYGSWQRRMVRLGHISFFGTGLLNLAYAGTATLWPVAGGPLTTGALMSGAVSMPAVCFLSAWRKPCRHLFFIPVISLLVGAAAVTWSMSTATAASIATAPAADSARPGGGQ